MEEKNYSLIAIVAIVAIIGIVVLVMNIGKKATTEKISLDETDLSESEDVAGGAYLNVKEQVKCLFDSKQMQKCFTTDGKFYCSGIGSCVANVYGYKGQKLTWKSSCGGYAYTIIDGTSEYAKFSCAPQVTEQVKCLFDGATAEQKCYSSDGQYSCAGVQSCVVTVTGNKGTSIEWKSSCGGYAYTVIDGDPEHATFTCTPTTYCKDTDGGKNFKVKGIVTDQDSEYKDYCNKYGYLIEFYCYENLAMKGRYSCKELGYTKCFEGACV